MQSGLLFWSHVYVRNRKREKREKRARWLETVRKRKILKNRDKHETAHIVEPSDWFRMQHPSLRSRQKRAYTTIVYLSAGMLHSWRSDECRPKPTSVRVNVRVCACVFVFAGFKRHLILCFIFNFFSHPINQIIKIQWAEQAATTAATETTPTQQTYWLRTNKIKKKKKETPMPTMPSATCRRKNTALQTGYQN